jgi:intergrase/recombinase
MFNTTTTSEIENHMHIIRCQCLSMSSMFDECIEDDIINFVHGRQNSLVTLSTNIVLTCAMVPSLPSEPWLVSEQMLLRPWTIFVSSMFDECIEDDIIKFVHGRQNSLVTMSTHMCHGTFIAF